MTVRSSISLVVEGLPGAALAGAGRPAPPVQMSMVLKMLGNATSVSSCFVYVTGSKSGYLCAAVYSVYLVYLILLLLTVCS